MDGLRRSIFLFLSVALTSLAFAPLALGEEGKVITFTSGTGTNGGRITVTNGATGSTTTSSLGQNLPAEGCANILSLAAPKVGLRTELAGNTVRVFGRGSIVNVVGATVTKAELAIPKPSKARGSRSPHRAAIRG